MGGGILSEAIILGVLCPLSSLRAAAFVPSQATFTSSWTQQQQHQQRQQQQQRSLVPQCREQCSGGRRSRHRTRGRRQSCGGVVLMQTDTDTGTEASSSATVASPAVSSPLIQFDGSDSGEVDSFLGELNFCLGPGDNVLSGPSLTKDLNTATNKMVKNLLILTSPEDEEHAVHNTDSIEAGFASVHMESPGFPEAQAYLSCVCQLAKEGCPSQEALDGLSEPYKLALRRVAGVLSDFGCSLTPSQNGRVRPTDENFCLSILDYINPDQEGGAVEEEGAGDGAGAAKEKSITSTRALNMLANRVVRTVCVGSDEDLQGLAREMESKRTKFLSKSVGKGWEGSQEDMYFGALVSLVRNGLTDEDPALKGAYLNSYQRLVGIVVQEVGTRSTPASEMILSSFLAWEREIRKELTEPAWESRPPDLIGSWALEAAGWDGLSDLPVDGTEMEDLGLNDLVVSFRKDGTVQVPVEKGVGLEWRLEPGPTHLDTIYFEMIPAAPKVSASSEAGSGGGTTLSYTGYVDRGARIEARFSKRFVKMTGRMTSVVRGQMRPSTRFSMRLVERGEAKGLAA